MPVPPEACPVIRPSHGYWTKAAVSGKLVVVGKGCNAAKQVLLHAGCIQSCVPWLVLHEPGIWKGVPCAECSQHLTFHHAMTCQPGPQTPPGGGHTTVEGAGPTAPLPQSPAQACW